MTAPMTSREAPEEIEHWIELLAEGRANLSAYEMRDISVTLRLLSERCEELENHVKARDAQLFVAEQELKRAGVAQGAAPYPSREAMMAAVELEIQAALGSVQTVVIGQIIQKAMDFAIEECAKLIENGAGMADVIDEDDLDQQAIYIRRLCSVPSTDKRVLDSAEWQREHCDHSVSRARGQKHCTSCDSLIPSKLRGGE